MRECPTRKLTHPAAGGLIGAPATRASRGVFDPPLHPPAAIRASPAGTKLALDVSARRVAMHRRRISVSAGVVVPTQPNSAAELLPKTGALAMTSWKGMGSRPTTADC